MIARWITKIGYLQALAAVGFTVLWVNLLLLSITSFIPSIVLLVVIAFLLPIFLLVQTVQYQSHRAYFFVMSIIMASMLKSTGMLIWQVSNWLEAQANPSLITCVFIDLPFEVIRCSFVLALGMLLLSILHSRVLAEIYQWNKRSFLLALFNALLLCGLLTWQYLSFWLPLLLN